MCVIEKIEWAHLPWGNVQVWKVLLIEIYKIQPPSSFISYILSLLSNIEKVIEKLMYKRRSYFLDINSLNTHCSLVFSKYSTTDIMINGLFQKKKQSYFSEPLLEFLGPSFPGHSRQNKASPLRRNSTKLFYSPQKF